jgi:hypothetical protein
MTDASLPNQASKPDQNIAAAQQGQVYAPPNPGGSAMLDADIAARENTNPEAEEFADPIATNFSSATATGESKTAEVSGEMGAFPSDSPSTEKGSVNLHNNPDVPNAGRNSLQGMPDTDPTGMPIDADTNLPD